jgi:hypothetical protein
VTGDAGLGRQRKMTGLVVAEDNDSGSIKRTPSWIGNTDGGRAGKIQWINGGVMVIAGVEDLPAAAMIGD